MNTPNNTLQDTLSYTDYKSELFFFNLLAENSSLVQ